MRRGRPAQRPVARAGCELPSILGDTYQTIDFPALTKVATDSTILRKSNGWIVGCGGVEINSWKVVNGAEETDTLGTVSTASVDGDAWWAN